MKKILAILLAAIMALGIVPALAETDTITVMVPPVTGTYLTDIETWAKEFTDIHPDITIEIIKTSWDEHNGKLTTMANAGEAPDIAEVSYSTIGTLVNMGVGIEVEKYLDADRLADYDQNALDYMSLEGHVYGLPLYITIQSIGGNKDMLTAAGADVAKIQSEGWTYEEFLEVIKNGTTENCFGFVFANSGVTAADFISIFGASAGITNDFTADLKYAYTSENMLKLLQAVEEMTSSGYMPNYAIEAGQRMVMCETGNAMIFGKAMPLFENNIKKNNAALEANDGTAVENSIPVNYAFLPIPTMEGVKETCFGSVDGLVALRNNNSTDEHLKNVCLFLDYLCSGDRAAMVDSTLLLDPVCQSGRDVYANYAPSGLDEGNVACAAREISLVVAPPAGITAEQSTLARQLRDEVIVPKFQALLAGEATAQEVYDAICSEAINLFGADGCASGLI
jgi:multiple sugar transport system substrate-binding protein